MTPVEKRLIDAARALNASQATDNAAQDACLEATRKNGAVYKEAHVVGEAAHDAYVARNIGNEVAEARRLRDVTAAAWTIASKEYKAALAALGGGEA